MGHGIGSTRRSMDHARDVFAEAEQGEGLTDEFTVVPVAGTANQEADHEVSTPFSPSLIAWRILLHASLCVSQAAFFRRYPPLLHIQCAASRKAESITG